MELSSKNVENIFKDCLFTGTEDAETIGYIKVEGITLTIGFHPDRLNKHKEDIIDMLMQLPIVFHQSSGGGMSFLNACQDINDKQWTGMHRRMEELFLLGIAINKVELLLPRNMWSAFPGGVPYVVVKDL